MKARSRREFIQLGVAGIGTAAFLAACGDPAARRLGARPALPPGRLTDDPEALTATIRALFGDHRERRVARVGRAYGTRFAADVDALAADLAGTVRLLQDPSPEGVLLSVAEAIADDCDSDRFVSVFGWQVPLTEARLAALLDLALAA